MLGRRSGWLQHRQKNIIIHACKPVEQLVEHIVEK
jgi:hypothetical protein